MSAKIAEIDTVIIGGGPAGLSAAMWCEELGLKALLLEKKGEFGGQLARVYNRIENHLGSDARDGAAMRERFLRQVENRGFARRVDAGISTVDLENKVVELRNGEAIQTRSLIIATGVSRRRLDIEGEKTFVNKGIVESGRKDPDVAEGKRVLIVGGGDAAVENALILSEKAQKIFIAHRRAQFRARPEFLDKAKTFENIEFMPERVLERIFGSESIEGAEFSNLSTGEREIIPAEIVLIRIGVEPNSGMFKGLLEMDGGGYIEVNARCETSVAGVYAIGDVSNPLSPTVSTAVGTGATAARAIYQYLWH
jgi:thioredoxin reductase (NADPH)